MIITLSNVEEYNSYICSDTPLVLDFYTEWCGPCRMITPLIKDLSKKYQMITFIKIDIDIFEDIKKSLNISSIPTFIFVKKNRMYGKILGADSKLLTSYVEKFSLDELSL